MAISIVYDDKEVRVALAALVAKMKNPEDLFMNIGESMVRQIHLRFEQGVGPDGRAWAPLKPSTIERKGHSRPLIRQGERGGLLGSINYRTSHDSVEIGTNMVYAAICQFGSKPHVIRPKNKRALFWKGLAHPVKEVKHPGTPPRPFLGFGETDKKKILGIIADYLALESE